MKYIIFTITILIYTSNFLLSQIEINKEDLYKALVESQEKSFNKFKKGKKGNIVHNIFNEKVINLYDSLKTIGVDTIGIYMDSYSGMVSNDSCDCNEFPWTAYIHWKENGSYFVNKIKCNCNFSKTRINYSMFLNYYLNCKNTLRKEFTVEPIRNFNDIDTDSTGKILGYILSRSVHVTDYFLYCETEKEKILKRLHNEQIESKDNIFYKENIDTKLYSWWKIIRNEIVEIEKGKNP